MQVGPLRVLPVMEEIRASPDYNWFRSTVSLKKVCVLSFIVGFHGDNLTNYKDSYLCLHTEEIIIQRPQVL